jgi:hypothetical protein
LKGGHLVKSKTDCRSFFGTKLPAINKHIKEIYLKSPELSPEATISKNGNSFWLEEQRNN